MKTSRIFSQVCLVVALVFVFTLFQAVLPKPVRGVNVEPSTAEAANPSSTPSASEEASEIASVEPTEEIPVSEEPSEPVVPSVEPEPSEEPEELIELEFPEIPEAVIGEYLIPISLADYEALLAAQPKLSEEEEAAELEKYTHTIANADGTFTKQIFFEPVRYQDESGTWQDIDTSLVQNKVDSSLVQSAAGEIDMTFATDKADGLEATLKKDDYSITFKLLPIDELTSKEELDNLDLSKVFSGAQTVLISEEENLSTQKIETKEVALKNAKDDLSIGLQKNEQILEEGAFSKKVNDEITTKEVTEEEAEKATNFTALKHKGVLGSNLDIKMTPTSSGIKEEIILNAPTYVDTFTYLLNLTELYLILLEDGNTILLDKETNEIVAMIPLPFMYDSAEELNESYDIGVNIQKLSDTEYLYQMTPDQEWLQAEDRVYPVVIDPSYTFQNNVRMMDTQVSSAKQTTNFSGETHMRIGRDSGNACYRSYFAIAARAGVGENKYITSATLSLYENYGGATSPTARLYTTANDPGISIMNWSTQPGLVTNFLNFTITSGAKRYNLNVTNQVRDMYDVPSRSGIIAILGDETQAPYQKFKRFSTSEAATAERPYLTVTYVDAPPATTNAHLGPSATWTRDLIELQWSPVPATEGTYISHYEYSTTSATTGFARLYPATETWGYWQRLDVPDGQRYIWIRAVNNYGLVGPAKQSSSQYYRDRTGPNAPTLYVNLYPVTEELTPTRKLSWYKVGDIGSGTEYYRIEKRTRVYRGDTLGEWSGWSFVANVNDNSTSLNYIEYFEDHPSGSMFQYRVASYDRLGNTGGWSVTSEHVMPKYAHPTKPENVSIAPNTWTNDTNPILSWSGISCVDLKNAQYRVNNSQEWISIPVVNGIGEGRYVLDTSNFLDGVHTIYVRGISQAGIAGEAESVNYYKATQAPTSILYEYAMENTVDTLHIQGYASNTVPLTSWKLVYGYGTQQPIDTLITIYEKTLEPNVTSDTVSYMWDTTGLSKNKIYSIYLIATDVAGNESISQPYVYMRTQTGMEIVPGLEITSPTGRITNKLNTFVFAYIEEVLRDNPIFDAKLIVNGSEVAANVGEGNTLSFNAAERLPGSTVENPLWKYPEGQLSFFYVQGKDENGNNVNSDTVYETTILSENYENTSSHGIYINDGVEFESEITIGQIHYLELEVAAAAGILYEISVDNGNTWREITPFTKLYSAEGQRGNQVKVRCSVIDTSTWPILSEIHLKAGHTAYTNTVLVDNDFGENARGFTALNGTWHASGQSSIILNDATSGSVDSTLRTVSADVEEAVLVVDEVKPDGTNITYQISTDGGVTFEDITPGDYNTPEDWKVLAYKGKDVVLRANLSSNTMGVTPELKGWTLGILVNAVGQPHVVQLVEDPTNLSTLSNANYGTLLRWKPTEESIGQDGKPNGTITYNIYRSESQHFQASEETLLASGISEPNYTDVNLNFGKTFWYQVTAVKMIDGYPRESLPSNQAWSTVVEYGEVHKKLGLQNYWSYAGFSTGSGDGYVNVNNGNLAYITTDMVVSDPFFASVMRRTYNSMATTKTPMGYGWDFSFNTTLMVEYDETGTTEVGMILKDGDGSFHRFPLNAEGGYDPAKGTFMQFAYDEAADEYTILRKDNVKYHFDAQSFKLKKFTNPNGNALNFAYDIRGNLVEIENTVGDKVYISYYVTKENDGEPNPIYVNENIADYTYINDHVDMVSGVRWEGSDGVVLEYDYLYGDDDKLDKAVILDEDNNEFKEEFAYDADGKMTVISNAANQAVTLHYDSENRIRKVDTPMSSVYSTFSYDAMRVYWSEGFSIELPQTITRVSDENGVGVNYLTDNEHGYLLQKVDPLNHSVDYTYNDALQVTSMSYQNQVEGVLQTLTNTYTYDAKGNITRLQGPAGAETVYEGYNSFNLPARVKVKNNGRWLTTSYTYDGSGNLLSTTDPTGKVMTNTYGTRNRNYGYLLSQTDRLGKVTSYAYDTKGRVTSVSENGGGLTRNTVQYTYDAYGRTASQTDAANRTTQLTYNKFGLLTATEYADGTTESVLYDIMGKVRRTTNAKGQETRYTYDALNRPIGVVYADGTINTTSYYKWDSDGNGSAEADKVVATDGEGRTSTAYYDKAGRTVKQEGGGASVRYEYDNIGNMVKQTQVGGNAGGVTVGDRVATAKYNALGQMTSSTVQVGSSPNANADITTRYTYDTFGNQLSVTDPLGNTTGYAYDDLNRLTRVSQNVNGTQLNTDYAYDIWEGSYIRNSVTDANGNRDDVLFDLLGNKVMDRTTGMQTNYAYNIDGSVNLVTRNDNTKVRYAYDNMGRVQSVNYYDANQDVQGVSGHYLSFTYDALGNPLSETVTKQGDSNITSYEYDSVNRVIQYTQGFGRSDGLSIQYTYNRAGQISETQYFKNDNQTNGNGEGAGYQVTTYGYDSYGRNINIHAGTADTLTGAETSKQLVREYTYNSVNEIVQTKDYPDFKNGGSSYALTNYTYDSIGRMSTKTYEDHLNGSATGVVKESHSLGYDKNGNILSEALRNNYGEDTTVNKSYVYDTVGRLTSATEDSKTTTYSYDNVGNRTGMTEEGKSYTYAYNNLDQLTSISEGGTVKSQYTYDARGNQTKEVSEHFKVTVNGVERIDNKVTDHSYDLLNQLTSSTVTTPKVDETTGNRLADEVNTSHNSYDAAGKRIKRVETINGVEETSRFYYMGSAVLYTSDAYNVLQTENILDLAGTTIMSFRFLWPYQAQNEDYANQWFTYRYDVRGSVTNITNPQGEQVKGYTYNEFGQTKEAGQASFKNELTFTGSVKDTSTGLQYMNARFYEPQTGRFLSQDTYSGNAYDPWAQNLYSYCGNNPVNFIDPTGHIVWWLGGIIKGAIDGVSQVVSNVVSGKPILQNVAGATLGGFVEGSMMLVNPKLANVAGNAVRNTVNEVESYITEGKELTWDNLKDSYKTVSKNTITDTVLDFVVDKATSNFVNSNAPKYPDKWAKPTKLSNLVKPGYATKVIVKNFALESGISAMGDLVLQDMKIPAIVPSPNKPRSTNAVSNRTSQSSNSNSNSTTRTSSSTTQRTQGIGPRPPSAGVLFFMGIIMSRPAVAGGNER